MLGHSQAHEQNVEDEDNNNDDEKNDHIWFAVPKTKVSRSRKRMKWAQHIPDKVSWSLCERCGSPKRPHRICSENMEICAMRDEEYQAHLASQGKGDEDASESDSNRKGK